MDLTVDELYNPGDIENTPCRWFLNARHCRHSPVFLAGYFITAVCTWATVLLTLIVFFRQGAYQYLLVRPSRWPPLMHLLFFFGLGNAMYAIHALLVLVDPAMSYAGRDCFRMISYPLVFSGFLPHLYRFVSMAASIDFDALHYGLSQRTIRHLLWTVVPISTLASILSILDAWAIDHGAPAINRWFLSVACILYIIPCSLLAWCSYEYGFRFSYIINAQIREANACASHPWNTTPLKAHDPSSPMLIHVALALRSMKSVHFVAFNGCLWTIVNCIIIASAQVNIFRIPIFSEIMFFSFYVSIGFLYLTVMSYIMYRDVFGYPNRWKDRRAQDEEDGSEGSKKAEEGTEDMTALTEVMTNTTTTAMLHPEGDAAVCYTTPASSDTTVYDERYAMYEYTQRQRQYHQSSRHPYPSF